jgi:hypothetical protein
MSESILPDPDQLPAAQILRKQQSEEYTQCLTLSRDPAFERFMLDPLRAHERTALENMADPDITGAALERARDRWLMAREHARIVADKLAALERAVNRAPKQTAISQNS